MGITESGATAKALVAEGEVLVDSAVELRKACKIRAGQVVETGDVQITVTAAPAA
jgi:ribosome-associated protein